MTETCNTCRFWTGASCRRFPPHTTGDYLSKWPGTKPDDSCGEWKAERSAPPLSVTRAAMASEPTDIVSRLRSGEACVTDPCRVKEAASGCLCAAAADEIERLRWMGCGVDD